MLSHVILKTLNRLFPLPRHPFNLNNDGIMTYSKWQYTKGQDTIKFFLPYATTKEMFENKVVLDIGCGACGKTLYYASLGVKFIYGIDVLEKYESQSQDLANELDLTEKFKFLLANAANLPLSDGYADTIIINDAMEHVANPKKVLQECLRVLAPGGRIYINFPPYYHPHGAHLSDAIGVPWVHMFFSDKTLIKVYKEATKQLPDGKERIAFRISKKDGKEYFSYINKMTIKRFLSITKELKIKPAYYKEVPLRSFFYQLAKLPLIKEMFVKMVVVVIEK